MNSSIATYPPLIVIERIMQYASFIPETQEAYQWKSKLSLLAVCHTWRKHGLRWIYRYAFYIGLNTASDKAANTNMKLILDNHYSSYTTSILIRLSNLKCLAMFLKKYEEIFNFETTSWLYTTKLGFIINDKSAIPEIFTEEDSSDEKDCCFAEFSQKVVQYMPKITHLNLQYKDDSSVSRSANTALFSAYCHQLASFNGFFVSSFVPTQIFENLTVLNVKFNPKTEHLLPAIDCAKLEKMYLSEIPFKFSWKFFCQETDAKRINFNLLNTLSLSYMDDPPDFDMFLPDEDTNEDPAAGIEQYEVHFPKLRIMNIVNTVGEPLLRSTYILPTELANLNIFNSFNMLNILVGIDLKAVNTTVLQFSNIDSENENNFYEYTNWLLGKNSSQNSGSLTIHNCSFKLDWEKIRWTNIRSLYLSKCDARTLTTILYYSTKLKSLTICEIVLEGMSDDLYSISSDNIGDASFRTMKPNDNLYYLEMRKVHNIEDTYDHAVILFQTMTCLFGNLKKFSVLPSLVKPLVQYAERYKSDYPHLEVLRVKSIY